MVFLAFFFLNLSSAQSLLEENKKIEKQTNKLLRSAQEDLADNDFASAEASYRQAVSKSPENVKARYNMANMYYGKEKPAQAVTRLRQAAKIAETKEDKHKIFHNLGNSFMEQKKYREAVDAYKDALRNNPKDEETRYNYALAKKMLEEEEQSGGGGDDDKEQEDQEKQDQDKGDQGEQDQDNQEGEDKEDKGGDPKDEPGQPEDQDENGKQDPKEEGDDKPAEQQPQPSRQGQLSPEQIKSLLEAMNNEEKKVQDKINAEKARGVKTRTDKDW